MNWTLEHQPGVTGKYELVNTTGGNAHGVTLEADDIAAQEVFCMSARGYVLTTNLILAKDKMATEIDLGRGCPEGGHITVEWQNTPGGSVQSQTIELHQHRD